MANAFVVRSKNGGHYSKSKHLGLWVEDKNKAFVWRRKSDASQMINRMGLKKEDFDIVPLVEETVVIPTPSPAQKFKYKIVKARPDSNMFEAPPSDLFDTEVQATAVRDIFCGKRYHTDYYKVEQVDITALGHIPPNWDDYLLGLAFVVAQRSPDSQTQHGCVLADKNHRILGTGYNGFPRGLDDAVLPKTRPEKYDWMIHSEPNAIANCHTKPEGATAYMTGEPCNQCLMYLWQNGIKKVIIGTKYCWAKDSPETRKVFDKFVEMSKMELVYAEPNFDWLFNLQEKIRERQSRK